MSPSIDPPRALTQHERRLLLFLLSLPAPEFDGLLIQNESVQVCGECDCGCGTIDLVVAGRPEGWQSDVREIVAEAWNLDDPEAPVQLMLHTVNGVLRELEAVWYTDEPLRRRPERVTPTALRLGTWTAESWVRPDHPP